MIVTHIFGGLGNQLFQFAIGRALADRLGVELCLDTRYFDIPRPGSLGMLEFGLCLPHFGHGCRTAERKGLPAMRHDGLLPYVVARIRGAKFQIYRESGLAYQADFENQTDNTWLRGYWQSEKYFRDHAASVRKGLQVVTPPGDVSRSIMERQDRTCAVSIHVRRGDYVTNRKFNATHGTCDLDYYRQAADHIAARADGDVTFFAFSDEPEWVRENLDLPHELQVVSHNGEETSFDDIRLMSRCRHHIVANSSFSWWGAWLNPDPDKMVIAPKRWFADPAMQVHDIVPEDWIRL